MKIYLSIIFFLFSIPAAAEMVVLHMSTEMSYSGEKEMCTMKEEGWGRKEKYYRFKAYPGSGGCHVKWPTNDFYKTFQFCTFAKEYSGNRNESGYCSINPSNDTVILSAMPEDGYYTCRFLCVTSGGYEPNYKESAKQN